MVSNARLKKVGTPNNIANEVLTIFLKFYTVMKKFPDNSQTSVK